MKNKNIPNEDTPVRRKASKRWGSLIILIAIVVGLWTKNYYALKDLDETDRGTFGDMFGGVNALFSGLALAGIIFTIVIQQDQMQIQLDDLKINRDELQLSRDELTLSRHEFIDQNSTLRRRRLRYSRITGVLAGEFKLSSPVRHCVT